MITRPIASTVNDVVCALKSVWLSTLPLASWMKVSVVPDGRVRLTSRCSASYAINVAWPLASVCVDWLPTKS